MPTLNSLVISTRWGRNRAASFFERVVSLGYFFGGSGLAAGLFVAGNTTDLNVEVISSFAEKALLAGMVYFCVWGLGCQRFHDMVDERSVEDECNARRFAGSRSGDVAMTTWHNNETLEEALDFFATCAAPSIGIAENSDFFSDDGSPDSLFGYSENPSKSSETVSYCATVARSRSS
jgi:hypothetical protein